MEDNVEVQARDNGWVPEENFKANPQNEGKKWRTAEEFMDRKSLFDMIDDQHKELRRLRDGMTALQQHNQDGKTVFSMRWKFFLFCREWLSFRICRTRIAAIGSLLAAHNVAFSAA